MEKPEKKKINWKGSGKHWELQEVTLKAEKQIGNP